MKDRLKQVRIKLGYSLIEMAEKLKIEANTYKGYEYKTKNLPCDFLISLINELNVNVNWLLTGSGTMFNTFPESDSPENCGEIEKIVRQVLIKEGLIK